MAVPPAPPPRPRLYVVALSHLDTQWRWTVRDTARRFLPETVRANERRFARFPAYVLSFEGAFRYRLLADCAPALFAIVRQRVTEGRWFPAGAAWEAFDANLPAPESILRQILYGRRWFEEELGASGRDLFLPDCFGFGWALPTLAVHAGIVGFSTQKLRRGALMRSAHGVPFPFGRWVGPDGSELLAVLDPGEYGAQASSDLAHDPEWQRRFAALAAAGRPALLETYQGLGDRGGALPETTVEWLERASRSDGPLEVRIAPSERIFLDLQPEERARLPEYRGELLLSLHATGCYSSRAQLKRWHRSAERLADLAERAASLARVTGRRAYPGNRLREAWLRVLTHQMHDDLTGTSIPAAYRYSAQDLALALNELAGIAADSIGSLAGALDTRTEGEPLLVFNPLPYPREELVAVTVAEPGERPPRMIGPDGREAAAQWRHTRDAWQGLILVRVPALGVAVYEARLGEGSTELPTSELKAGERSLANLRYRATLDEAGDVAGLHDLLLARELLAGPAGLEILANRSTYFPAWEMHYADLCRAPRTRVGELERFTLLETGPLRITFEVVRRAEGSRFRQRVSLAAGASGDWLEIVQEIDWRSDAALLKAGFRVPWRSPEALYDLGVGAIGRPVNSARLYEVPAQQWAALLDGNGQGLGILSQSAQGWDHPAEDRLRLTLLHTPAIGRRLRYQHRQDFAHHRFRYALAGVRGPSAPGELARLAERFRLPLTACWATRAPGPLGREYSLLESTSSGTELMALKGEEAGPGLVARFRETSGRGVPLRLRGATLESAKLRPLDGREQPLDPDSPLEPETVERALPPYGLATFGVELLSETPPPESTPACALPHDLRGITAPGERGGGFDRRGHALAQQFFPRELRVDGLSFTLAADSPAGAPNVTRCRGQRLTIPAGFATLVLLGATVRGALEVEFRITGRPIRHLVQDWSLPLGRFDEPWRWPWGYALRQVRPGCLTTAPVLYTAPHRHRRGRVDPCRTATLFGIALPLDGREAICELPDAPRLRLVAAALARRPWPAARPAHPLFD